MRRVSWSNVLVGVLLVAFGATCSGCSLPPPERPVEPPRLYCLNMGRVSETPWWVYACTFIGGDSLDVPPPIENLPIALEASQ